MSDRSAFQEFRTFLYGLLPARAGFLRPAIDDVLTSFPTLPDLAAGWPLGYKFAVQQGKGSSPDEFARVRRQVIRRARSAAVRGPRPYVANPGWPAIRRPDRFGRARA